MNTIDERRRVAAAGVREYPGADGFATRVFLQPIAAPSILGLAGFAGATFIVASNLAGWWGTPSSPLALAPFAAMFGGLAQFLAGMWAYKARDAIATLAALAESLGLTAVLSTLAAGSGILAGAFIYGSHGWTEAAGWVFVFSAGFAWYVATAMMLSAAGGRVVLPLGKFSKAANRPGGRVTRPVELEWAEPGVRMGQ